MTEKQKNLIIRTLTGIVFVACMVSCFLLDPRSMVCLFALITGLSIWEFGGLVNQCGEITVNRFISTVSGVYFFIAGLLFAPPVVSVLGKDAINASDTFNNLSTSIDFE